MANSVIGQPWQELFGNIPMPGAQSQITSWAGKPLPSREAQGWLSSLTPWQQAAFTYGGEFEPWRHKFLYNPITTEGVNPDLSPFYSQWASDLPVNWANSPISTTLQRVIGEAEKVGALPTGVTGLAPQAAWQPGNATSLVAPPEIGSWDNAWPEAYVAAIERLRPTLESAQNPQDALARQQALYYQYLAQQLTPILSNASMPYTSYWNGQLNTGNPIYGQAEKMLNAAISYAPGSQGITDRRSLAQQADYERIMKDLMSWVPEMPPDLSVLGSRDRFGVPYNNPKSNVGENWAKEKDIWTAIAPKLAELIDPNLMKNPQTGQPTSEVATPAWAAGNLPERKLWGATPQNQTNYRNTNSWFTPRWG